MQTETFSRSATFVMPVRVLLLVSSRAAYIESEVRINLEGCVVTRTEPHSFTYVREMLGRHDILLADTKSFESLDDFTQSAIRVAHIPFVLLIRPSEEQHVLDEICPTGILWDFIMTNDMRKIPFVINRYYESVSEEIQSKKADEIVYQFRIKKLTDQNLLLMDQLSEKDRILKEFLHNENQFRMMVESSGDVVYSTNYKGEFVYLNPRVKNLTGYTNTELVGKHYLELVHPDQRKAIEEFYYNQFQNRVVETVKDFRIVCKGGEIKWVEQTVRLISEGDRVKGFQCIVRDVNERKRYERKLFEHATLLEKSNKDLEMFAYVASHDLKEPLRKITTFSSRVQALPEMKSLSEKGRDYLARMNAAAKRMEAMIEDLLSYSRITRSPERYKECDLNKILGKAIGELEEEITSSGAKIEVTQLPKIKAIESQVGIMLVHLINNALKFAKPGEAPDIRITCESVESSDVPCPEARMELTYVKLCVIDKGIGFEKKYSNRIFEIFQRLHGKSDYSGTGIGLPIVKKIAERHHGCVKAIGEPGVGSEFQVYLPEDFYDVPIGKSIGLK